MHRWGIFIVTRELKSWKGIYRVSRKNAISECCWSHSALAQSQVAGSPCVWKLMFWSFRFKTKPDQAFPSHVQMSNFYPQLSIWVIILIYQYIFWDTMYTKTKKNKTPIKPPTKIGRSNENRPLKEGVKYYFTDLCLKITEIYGKSAALTPDKSKLSQKWFKVVPKMPQS